MKKLTLYQVCLVSLFLLLFSMDTLYSQEKSPSQGGTYTLVIEGFDWGAAVSKVIISLDAPVTAANARDYRVKVQRNTKCLTLSPQDAQGERSILYAYVSDAQGNKKEKDQYITLVMTVGPDLWLGAPLQFFWSEECQGTSWLDYQVSIEHIGNNRIWDQEKNRLYPDIENFDLDVSFTYKKDLALKYAAFKPSIQDNKKYPLIIWLHGGGEGGTDTRIPLLANRAANYASEEIQTIFGGAYVLVPQSPSFWMDSGNGKYTQGKVNDIYNESLMALFKDFVTKNPAIDTDRIYIGGCSNGGYMSLKLLLLHPDYFAAGYISALAYFNEHLTDEQIQRISHIPTWYVHAKDDGTTPPNLTVLPIYKRLMAAGAKDVHFSYYDHVIDITGFFGGENYYYNGHLSWIFCHANYCRRDFDGSLVLLDGRPTTIMEWMAAQSKAK